MNERDYRFAKVEEQVRKINRFLCISTAILNLISFAIIFVKTKKTCLVFLCRQGLSFAIQLL